MSSPDWNILYRGSLSSCNYACEYCPFAKTTNTRKELAIDAAELSRFCDWVESRDEQIGILFTPWGEALIRSHYREAMVKLSYMKNVSKVAIQTNLSCSVGWINEAHLKSIAFWCTFHPGETDEHRFIEKCNQLTDMGANYSVGVVGLREHYGSIESLRTRLPKQVYLWINAYKRNTEYYQPDDLVFLKSIDPYFKLNCQYYPSQGSACTAGHKSFTVNGNGDAYRCHFIKDCIGNIYQPHFAQSLQPSGCSNISCGCHIGYVHMNKLKMTGLYGDGLLERIPAEWPTVDKRFLL